MPSSYISLTVTNDKIIVVAKTEEDLRKLLEALRKYGIQISPSVATRCG